MSLVRLLPAWLHAIADYAVGIALIAVALLVHASGKATAAGVVIGAVILVVSLLTRYPLGLIKVLPFKVHSAADYLAVVLLVASPFVLSFTKSDHALTVVYIAAGVAVLGVSLVTNYQYAPARSATTEWVPAAAPVTAAAEADRGDANRCYAAAATQRRAAVTATATSAGAPEAGRSGEAWRDLPETTPPAREAWRALPGAATPAREAWRDLPGAAPAAAVPAPELESEPEPQAAAPIAAPGRTGVTLEQVLAELAALQRPDAAA
jgi:hypothetical protein